MNQELLAQDPPCTIQPRPNGPDRDIEVQRDLAIVEPIELAKLEGDALVRGQSIECALQPTAQLPTLRVPLGIADRAVLSP